jgi:hypothetical protein
MPKVVRIKWRNELASRCVYAVISRGRDARILPSDQADSRILSGERRHYVCGLVGRAVVYDDDLYGIQRLIQSGTERSLDVPGHVACGHDDGN